MDLTKEQSQRKEFCDILFELAKNQEILQDKATRHEMYKRLEALYNFLIKRIDIDISIQIYLLC